MRRALIVTCSLALLSVGLVGSVGSPAAARGDGTIRLHVMTFNIREGGVHGQFSKVVEAIRKADADVVGLQEPFGRTRKLAKALGWYAAPRLHTISRFPILQPAGSDGFWGWLSVAPGKVVTIANIHNPSYPYSVDMMRLGTATKTEILHIERHVRVRWMQPFLDALQPQLDAGDPVFFTGDFNAPSWRDWTPEVVDALGWQPTTLRYRAPRFSVRWPTSLVMERAGFRDSFREVRPDAIAEPGFTWTSGHPGISPWDVFDRIDFVWAAGSSETLSSRVVGDDDPMSDVVVEPWPSDHRAVVSTFDVTPADAPAFVSPLDVRVPIGRPGERRVPQRARTRSDRRRVGAGRRPRRRPAARVVGGRRRRDRRDDRARDRCARAGHVHARAGRPGRYARQERVRGRRSVGPRDHRRVEDPVRGGRADHRVVDERARATATTGSTSTRRTPRRPPAGCGSGATSTRGSSARRGSRRRRPGTGRSRRAGIA